MTSTFATGFSLPEGLAFDSSDNLYVGNSGNGTVSKVTPGGAVSTFASGFPGRPQYIAFDGSGNLFVTGYDTGTVSVVGLMFLAPPLAAFALRFGPPEYLALLTLGLSVTGMNWIVMPALTRRLGPWLRR